MLPSSYVLVCMYEMLEAMIVFRGMQTFTNTCLEHILYFITSFNSLVIIIHKFSSSSN